MAIYKVLETSYINDSLVEAGRNVEYTLPPGTTAGPNLRLLKGVAAERAANDIADADAEKTGG